MQHKFPFAVLHFELDPQEIDVNVHPSKMQIRIHRGNELYAFLSGAVSEALHETELIPEVKLSRPEAEKREPQKAPEPFESTRIRNLAREEAPQYTVKSMPVPEVIREKPVHAAGRVLGAPEKETVIKAKDHILVEKPVQMNLFEEKILTADTRDEYVILGQIFDTYWLISVRDKLLFVDQHAAHEKVKYERLVKALSTKETASQLLNPPVILNLTGKERELLAEFLPYFGRLGFELEEFGGDAFAVRSMPTDLYGCGEKELFMEILDELSENPMKGTPEVILHKLASMACKSAVKGNSRMNRQEMEALIDELLTLEDPYHCPHGRPTIISMSRYEIEKKFRRIV